MGDKGNESKNSFSIKKVEDRFSLNWRETKMYEKPLMVKENKRIVLFFIMIASFASIFLSSCQSSEADKWTPPKFVKEWEIKEIKPGLQTHIISMTANKNGVYVLVKTLEIKYSPPPKITQKASEMTEKEKENFINQIIMGRLFSGSAILNMTQKDKEELISLIINHFIPPRNSKDMGEKEKDDIIQYLLKLNEEKESERNRDSFKEALQKKGKDGFVDSLVERIKTSIKEEIDHFRIQHYDFEGNFISQWPEENKLNLSDDIRDRIKPILIPRSFPYKETIHIDSRDYLIEPKKILSDDSGYLYLPDYKGNKIVKFDSTGKTVGLWRIFRNIQTVEIFPFYGVTITKKNHILLIGEGKYLITPKLCEFDSGGRLLRSEELKSKIEVYSQLLKSLVPPLFKIERVADMSADDEGNIYIFLDSGI